MVSFKHLKVALSHVYSNLTTRYDGGIVTNFQVAETARVGDHYIKADI